MSIGNQIREKVDAKQKSLTFITHDGIFPKWLSQESLKEVEMQRRGQRTRLSSYEHASFTFRKDALVFSNHFDLFKFQN